MPSFYSFLWVILLIPLISIMITSSMALFDLFQLSIYSLPFNLIVLLFLYILKFRERFNDKPEIVVYQQFSPEKNLYSQVNNKLRFRGLKYIPVSLPFWGEWFITQGQNGEHTHQGQWSNAWDFEIKDEKGRTFKSNGRTPEDYYCYKKPVIAPADGWIENIIDGIDDNEIGDMNLDQNWGNSIVVKHHNTLFSQLSHLKKDSFKVKKGDYVKKGDILAYCGSSGRSPVPHLHFQLQETPYIGSNTLAHPIGYYIIRKNGEYDLRSYHIPEKNETISNIKKNVSLFNAFRFVPGRNIKLKYFDQETNSEEFITWEVKADLYGNTFIHCSKTKAKAYFTNDGLIHLFTNYQGKKNTLLYYFYLAAYKFILGNYKGIKITDTYPANTLNNKMLIWLQDFIAPFYMFLKPQYQLFHHNSSDELSDDEIIFSSRAYINSGNKFESYLNFDLKIQSNKLKEFKVTGDNVNLICTTV